MLIDIQKIVEPLYFGNPVQKLYGVYHQASVVADKEIAVIMLYPFGNEYMASYKGYLAMADKLAEDGYHVFRFDYYGTGDSYGSGEEARVSIWLKNLSDAIKEIKEGINIDKVFLFGLRLGGSLCILNKLEIEGLILWNPVLDGKDYLVELKKNDKDYFDGSFGRKKRNKNHHEFIGFPMSHEMYSEISKINLAERDIDKNIQILVIDNFKKKSIDKFITMNRNKGVKIDCKEITNSNFWIRKGESKIVPIEEIDLTLEWINNIRLS